MRCPSTACGHDTERNEASSAPRVALQQGTLTTTAPRTYRPKSLSLSVAAMPPLGRAVATFAHVRTFFTGSARLRRGRTSAPAVPACGLAAGRGRAWPPAQKVPGTSRGLSPAAARLRSIRPPSRAGQGRNSSSVTVHLRVPPGHDGDQGSLDRATDVLHCSAIGSAPLYGPEGHVPPRAHVSTGPLKPSTVSAGARVRLSCDEAFTS